MLINFKLNMELTPEQHQIINSTGDIKINAVAGSGKTTTIIEYARTRPKSSKILYLAFNKSVKDEAKKKFSDKGIENVEVETAHSFAYKHVVYKHRYKVRKQDFKTYELAELLSLQGNGEKHTEYILANHILKFAAYFCNSDKQKVQELNYLDVVSDRKAKAFVSSFYTDIENKTRLLLQKMDKGEIEITHDFYLKKFQLSNPKLYYDYILFDEGQDASPAMLDIFLKQTATKIIVGDTHQQIYGWRFAVNSLEKANFKNLNLSTSFRFDQEIANLAMEVLKLKKYLDKDEIISIIGKGNSKELKTKAILARTNLGLLLEAIEYVAKQQEVKHIYFEGNISSYTYADEGTSLYDVLNLYNLKHNNIKDKLIKSMKNIDDLEDYIEKTEDVQLGMMVEIVRKYGNEIYNIIQNLKNKHTEKEEAEIIFSTIHKSKGMEYDSVQLVNDFVTEEKLEKHKAGTEENKQNPEKLNEEINLLYVAITRTKNMLSIPEILIPINFSSSSQIHAIEVLIEKVENQKTSNEIISSLRSDEKAYTFDAVRVKHKDAYKPWTAEFDDELITLYCKATTVSEIAKYFGRTTGAITSRIKKLELVELYGNH